MKKNKEKPVDTLTADYIAMVVEAIEPISALEGLRDPLAVALGCAYKRGFNAACYDQPALKVLSSLRFRAHREDREALARLIGDLEYRIQNWDHPPTRKMSLPEKLPGEIQEEILRAEIRQLRAR